MFVYYALLDVVRVLCAMRNWEENLH